MDDALQQLAIQVGAALQARDWQLTCAESCTGGWASMVVTSVPGSSAWFDRGFVTYANEAKQDMLGVRPATLQQFGAVSEATVREMARGALAHSRAQLSLAISGVAGPGGGTVDKPVGLVWFAWCWTGGELAEKHLFSGDREAIRHQSVEVALAQVLKICGN